MQASYIFFIAAAAFHFGILPTVGLLSCSPLQPADSLCVVSQSEFQTLPNYLRRMTLSNLNQAVGNINTFAEQSRGHSLYKELSLYLSNNKQSQCTSYYTKQRDFFILCWQMWTHQKQERYYSVVLRTQRLNSSKGICNLFKWVSLLELKPTLSSSD